MAKRLILASASPRRQELLRGILPEFDTRPCPHAEPQNKPAGVSPQHWAAALSYFKARAVADNCPDNWVLGADTVVACGGRLLGKPQDAGDAGEMLRWQAGRESDVITGLSLVHLERKERIVVAEVTRVWMRDDPAELAAYVAGGDWAGKAGAYGIQDVGDRLVERIEGSFFNVVGLPIERLTRLLRRIGLDDDVFGPSRD
ncbi:MAG: Maf family protein [Phycisphaerae bacterium]|jgi:septum formation protein